MSLTTDNAQQLVCESNTFVWLWTKDVARQGFPAHARAKGVAGALFRKSQFENAYALSAVGLATPTRGAVRLTLHRSDSGKIMYAGRVAPDGSLELKARNHPGLAAVNIKAKIEAGRVEVSTAKSAAVVREAKIPKRS